MSKLSPETIEHIIAKFLLNLPREELEDTGRLSHQAEKGFYYYLDHILGHEQATDWKKQRKDFFNSLKEYAPNFMKINPAVLSDRLMESKPVSGAIIFNKDTTKVLVVRVDDKFGFPKGKLNQGETLEGCAVREVWEETGIDILNRIDKRIFIEFVNHEGKINFFVARGVAEEERLRIDSHEIDEVIWMRIEDIKRDISKFAERSKIAWSLYEKETAANKYSSGFMPKYATRESEAIDYSKDPMRNFKFDLNKLSSIMQAKNAAT
jgi:8-oxo-dGTP pyrophosphatase MutT (NUDIX family)